MSNLNPTQRAICAVILENGGWCSVCSMQRLEALCDYSVIFTGGWIDVDNHTVTEQEYREYEREES